MTKNIVLVDLDGTLSLNEHRKHLVESKPQHWDEFYLASSDDEPNVPVIETIKLLKQNDYKIHIFSGRGAIAKKITINWLERYHVPYDELRMRPIGNSVPDDVLKEHWLKEAFPDYLNQIFCVFDDRDKVVKMWRRLGLTCFQVAEGDF